MISGVFANLVVKPLVGRERPEVSGRETVLRPFSHDPSFPSGHTTAAFSVAFAVAMRSDGWAVLTIAYTAASRVGVSRVALSKHFASDVFAGAVLGTAVARFVAGRHLPEATAPAGARVTVLAIPHGAAPHVSW